MPLPVRIEPARPEDVDQVWPLARDFATSFRPAQATFRRTFATLVGAAGVLLLVARPVDDDRICGYLLAHLHLTFLADGPVVGVEELMVDPGRRRLGVGRALMAGAEQWARRHDAAYVSLASRRAGPFYRALAYEESATFFRKLLP